MLCQPTEKTYLWGFVTTDRVRHCFHWAYKSTPRWPDCKFARPSARMLKRQECCKCDFRKTWKLNL